MRIIYFKLRLNIEHINYNELLSFLNMKILEKRRTQLDAMILYNLLMYFINSYELVNEFSDMVGSFKRF